MDIYFNFPHFKVKFQTKTWSQNSWKTRVSTGDKGGMGVCNKFTTVKPTLYVREISKKIT